MIFEFNCQATVSVKIAAKSKDEAKALWIKFRNNVNTLYASTNDDNYPFWIHISSHENPFIEEVGKY